MRLCLISNKLITCNNGLKKKREVNIKQTKTIAWSRIYTLYSCIRQFHIIVMSKCPRIFPQHPVQENWQQEGFDSPTVLLDEVLDCLFSLFKQDCSSFHFCKTKEKSLYYTHQEIITVMEEKKRNLYLKWSSDLFIFPAGKFVNLITGISLSRLPT